MASSPSTSQIERQGVALIYAAVGLTLQTFFFGVYSVLALLSTRMLLSIFPASFVKSPVSLLKFTRKQGLKTRANHVMFIGTVFTYLLSAASWTFSVVDFIYRMRLYIYDLQNPLNFSADHDIVTKWSPLFNALVLVNYVFSDAIVVWRAWIICWRNYRKYLCVTIVFLVLTAITVTCTIIFRIIDLIKAPYAALPHNSYLTRGIDILQISNIGFSLISNLSATAVVGATAWRHRRTIRAAFADNKKSTKADQILTMVVESGALYCVSGLTVLIASLIRLPFGTLGDIYTPINVQIAGAYPPVVLLLVSMQRSLSETTFLNTFEGSTPTCPIQFGASNSPSTSGHRNRIQFARNPEFSRTNLGSEEEAPDLDSDIEMISANDNPREKLEEPLVVRL